MRNKIKFAYQHDNNDCGAACLYMICSFYNKEYSFQYLRSLINTGQNGVSLWDMKIGASKIGFNVDAYNSTAKELFDFFCTNHKSPLLLHLKNNHFVILKSIKKNSIELYDPAVGIYRINVNDFFNIWSGNFLSFSCIKDFKENEIIKKENIVFVLARKNVKKIFFLFIVSIILSFTNIAMAHIFEIVFGTMNDKYNLIKSLIFFIIIYIFSSCFSFIRGVVTSRMSNKIDNNLAKIYYEKIFSASSAEVKSRKIGEYISRITDLTSVRDIICNICIPIISDFIFILINSVYLCYLDVNFFLCALAFLIIFTLFLYLFNKKFIAMNYKILEKNAEVQSYLKEMLQGYDAIKMYNISSVISDKFFDKYKNYSKSVLRNNIFASAGNMVAVLIELLGQLTIILIGFEYISKNQMHLEDFMTVFMIFSSILMSVKSIMELQGDFQYGRISLNRFEDIYGLEKEEDGENEFRENIKTIKCHQITFAYPGSKRIIKGLNLDIDVNRTKRIGITGKNGSGKSTLMKLILGIEKPISGDIIINEKNIKDIKKSDIRHCISYIGQEDFMLSDTIYHNIDLYQGYSVDEIIQYAKMTNLDDFVQEQNLKYDSYINENGENLSKGQRQSLAITRALIRKPKLIILDEATSNLDKVKEESIMNNIFSLDIPCIVITHDKNILDKMDLVINM